MRALALCLCVAGCAAVPRRIQRDTLTYAAEIRSALVRQEAAAAALETAAAAARDRGDVDACTDFVGPALEIRMYARLQADRALWLAGLPYPVGEPPTLPPSGTEQGDPLVAWDGTVLFAVEWCGGGDNE